MDPVVREIARCLNEVPSLWEKEEVVEYFAELGKKLGFKVFRNYSDGFFKVPCVWMERGVFAAFDVEFGSAKEVVGALTIMNSFKPVLSILVTKDVEKLAPGLKKVCKNKTMLIDARERKWVLL